MLQWVSFGPKLLINFKLLQQQQEQFGESEECEDVGNSVPQSILRVSARSEDVGCPAPRWACDEPAVLQSPPLKDQQLWNNLFGDGEDSTG